MERGPSAVWVIPLFGQAVNNKKHCICWMHGGSGGLLVEDVFNPAGSLMIPLCECTHSCVLSFPSTLKCAFILAFRLAFVHVRCSLAGCRTLLLVVGEEWGCWGGRAGGQMEVVVLERRLYDVPDYPPSAPTPSCTPQIHSISSLYPSGSTAAQRITKRGLAVTSHWRDGWARVWGRVSTWVCVCVRWVWVLCVCVCVQDWLDIEGGGEREARIREPSESWLGADTTPPHQGLNLLRDQTHLRWAGIIISSIGQFLYYSHPSTWKIWTLVKHLWGPVSCFSLIFFYLSAAIIWLFAANHICLV